MSERDSSDRLVSVVVQVFKKLFRLRINCCMDLLQILCGCCLVGPLPNFLK